MAERVEIMVVAQDAASQVLRGITSNFGALGSMVQDLTGGRMLENLAGQFIKFGKESVDATVKYANEVRNLTLISGESAESSSRFLQVLDDYKISAEDAMAATRAMTKEGLVPNIDTLAQLSDEYLSITDKQKQNEFVIKNLGRAGLQWVDILNKGGRAIREQGDAVSESLLLSDKQLTQARELEIAMDNWGDSVEGLKLEFGTQLIPALTDGIDVYMALEETINRTAGTGIKAFTEFGAVFAEVRQEQDDMKDSMIENAEAADVMTAAHEKTKEELEAEKAAAKKLTETYEGYLSFAENLYSTQTDYLEEIASLTEERARVEAEWNEETRNGLSKVSEKAEDYRNKLSEIDAKIEETKQKHHEAMGQMSYDLIVTKLSAEGLTSAEYDIAIQAGLTFGVFDQESANAAVAMNSLTDMVAAGKISVYEYGEIMKRSMKDGVVDAAELQRIIAEIPGQRDVNIDVYTNYHSLPIMNYDFNVAQGGRSGAASGHGRAGGGGVEAGTLYRVNETRTEYFQPSMNGTVVPLGRGGNGGGSGMTFVYSPQMSLGSAREAESIIMPFVEQAVRRMQSDGRAGL